VGGAEKPNETPLEKVQAKPKTPGKAAKTSAPTSPVNVQNKPQSPAKPDTSPVLAVVKPAKSPAAALNSPSRTEAKSPAKKPTVTSPPGANLRELEHQSPVKPTPAVVIKANSTAKATVGDPSSSSQSEHRSPSPEFLPDEAQAPDISGGRILFGAGLSPTKPPVKPAVARVELQEDSETEDDDEETVIQRAAHATIRPGGRGGRKRRRRKW